MATSSRPCARRACALLAGCALLLGVAVAGAHGGDEHAEAPAAALFAKWESLLAYQDFSSFSSRMETIRDLGRLRTPAAAGFLLRIMRGAKSIDDQVVALIAVGPLLDPETAAQAGKLVAGERKDVLTEALGTAYTLAEGAPVEAWIAEEALDSELDAVARAALEAQRVQCHPAARTRTLELYAENSPTQGNVDVAHAAVQALGCINGRAVRPALLHATAHTDWRIRLAAADVMARQKPYDLNVRGALRQLLADPVPVVRQTTAAAIGDARLDELVPELAGDLDAPHLRTRAIVHAALRRISGKDLGFDPADWLEWWKHRDADPTERPAPSTSVATYYGLNVHSDRVLFIVDLSGSMAFPWGGIDTRIAVARKELAQVLGRLSKDTWFNVIVFSDKVRAWRRGEARADPETVARALAWIEKTFVDPTGGTYMHAALEQAFAENPKIDTIFLLTDGLATDGEPIVPEAILASLSIWNRYRRVVIHTIALTLEDLDPTGVPKRDLREIKRFMRQIATATGGEAKFVTKPP